MDGCGRFQAIRVLHESGAVALWSSRLAGADAGAASGGGADAASGAGTTDPFVIKMLRADMHLTGGSELARDMSLFQESAELQRAVQKAGGARWAKVHELARSTEGVAFVMDQYPWTVAKLVSNKVRPGDSELFKLVRAIAEGLQELKQLGGDRPHGSLRASNILLGSQGLEGNEIFLVDPAPRGKLTQDDSRRDMQHIGAIIFQLVMSRAVRDLPPFPIKDSPEWSKEGSLGAAGPWWLQVCNRLVEPAGGPGSITTVEGLLEELGKPRGGGAAGGKKIPLIIGGVLAAAAVAVGAFVALRPAPNGEKKGQNGQEERDIGPVSDIEFEKWSELARAMNWYYPLIGPDAESRWTDLLKSDVDGRFAAGRKIINDARAAKRTLEPWVAAAETLPMSFTAYGERLPTISEESREGVNRRFAQAYSTMLGVRSAIRQWKPFADLTGLQQTLADAAAKNPDAPAWAEAGAIVAAASADMVEVLEGKREDPGALAVAATNVKEAAAGGAELAKAIDAATAAVEALKANPLVKDDPILQRIDEALASAPPLGSGSAKDKLGVLVNHLNRIATLAPKAGARLAEAQKGAWRHAWMIDREDPDAAFQSLVTRVGSAPLTADAVEQWIAMSAETRFIPSGDDPRGEGKWLVDGVFAPKALETLGERIEAARKKLPTLQQQDLAVEATTKLADADNRRKALLRRVGEITQLRDKRVDEIRSGVQEVNTGVAGLKTEIDSVASRVDSTLELQGQNAERYWASLESRTLGAGAALDDVWRKGIAEIKARHGDMLVGASKDVGDWEKLVPSIPAQLPAEITIDVRAGLDAAAIRTLVSQRRQRAIDQAAAAMPTFTEAVNMGTDGVNRRLREIIAGYAQWREDAENVLDRAGELRRALDDAYGPNDPLGDGQDAANTMRAIDEAMSQNRAYGDFEAFVSSLRARVKRLTEIAGESDAQALGERVMTSQSAAAAEALASWFRLGELGSRGKPAWPASLDDLNAERGMKPKLDVLLDSLSEARRAELSRRIADERSKRWTTGFAAMTPDRATLREALSLKADFGVADADIAALPAHSRYNIALGTFLEEAGGLRDAALEQRVRSFITEANALNAGAAAGDLTAQLSQVLDVPPAPIVAPPETEGPAKAGWAGRAVDGETVSFTKGGSTLVFVRVQAGSSIAYLSQTEISVEQFIEITRESWASVRELMLSEPERRVGPVTWTPQLQAREWRGITSSGRQSANKVAGWFQGAPSSYPPARPEARYYPDGVTVDPPTPDAPMQWVSVGAALQVARLLNCRFPTASEWRAALAASPTASPNLRDGVWERTFNQVVQTRGMDLTFRNWALPNTQIFRGKDEPFDNKVSQEDDKAAGPGNDGIVWFAPVGSGSEKIRHLNGNVAEYALADGASTTITPSKQMDWNQFRVMGASALSPPDRAADAAGEIRSGLVGYGAGAGFSDVGIRLAFTSGPAGPEPLDRRVANVLGAARFAEPTP
jgi:hypothetical protein